MSSSFSSLRWLLTSVGEAHRGHVPQDSFSPPYDPSGEGNEHVPFYAPRFLFDFERLVAGIGEEDRRVFRVLQADWSTDRLRLFLDAELPASEDSYTIYIIDQDGRIFSPRTNEPDWIARLQRQAIDDGFRLDDLSFRESPITYVYPSERGEINEHVLVFVLGGEGRRSSHHDIVDEALSRIAAGGENPRRIFQRRLELAYLSARYGRHDEGGVPLKGYTDSAILTAFDSVHPRTPDGLSGEGVLFTPLVPSPLLARLLGAAQVWIKDESGQVEGSFKIRGATHYLKSFLREAVFREANGKTVQGIAAETGVVVASHGNHALGAVTASRNLGFARTIVVMPDHEQTSRTKIRACERLGARVILHGKNLAEAMRKAREIQESNLDGELPGRIVFVPTYDDERVSLGQGTDAMELIGWKPSLLEGGWTYVVPAGGLGKIAGDATYLARMNPDVRIVGVNRDHVPAFKRSLAARRYLVRREEIEAPETGTLSDGNDVPDIGRIPFAQLLHLGSQIGAQLVSEEEIERALVFAATEPWYNGEPKIIEGAAAGALAALLSGGVTVASGDRVVISITGGNIDEGRLQSVLRRHRRGPRSNGTVQRWGVPAEERAVTAELPFDPVVASDGDGGSVIRNDARKGDQPGMNAGTPVMGWMQAPGTGGPLAVRRATELKDDVDQPLSRRVSRLLRKKCGIQGRSARRPGPHPRFHHFHAARPLAIHGRTLWRSIY